MKKLIFSALFFFTINAIYSQDLIITNDGDSIKCKVTEIKSGNIYFDFEKEGQTRNTMLPLSKVSEQQRDYYSTKPREVVISQDLIATNTGDSIRCKITNIDSLNIYFDFKKDDDIKSTMLALSKVKEHKKDYYTKTITISPLMVDDNYKPLRISISGGYSYRLAELAEDLSGELEDYTKDLKSGYHYGADITYFHKENYGMGLKYNAFRSKNSMDVYADNYGYGKMSDDITIHYCGPTFNIRTFNTNKKDAFLMTLSVGYLRYVDNATLLGYEYKITGNTIGTNIGLGYDIGLSENLALGLGVAVTVGSLSKVEVDYGTSKETIDLETEKESLTRLDLSIALIFNK